MLLHAMHNQFACVVCSGNAFLSFPVENVFVQCDVASKWMHNVIKQCIMAMLNAGRMQ